MQTQVVLTNTKKNSNLPVNAISVSASKLKFLRPQQKKPPLSTGRKLMIRAMLDNGASIRQVAFQEHVHYTTVRKIKLDDSLKELMPESKAAEMTKKALGNSFYYLADASLQKASEEERLDRMSSFQLAGIAGLAFDKGRLAEGLSTENISIRGVVGHLQSERDSLRATREALEAELARG